MRKAVLGALVAVAVAFGLMTGPAAAHERTRGDHDRHERHWQREDHRERHRDRGDRRGDWDRRDRDRGDWDRGDWDRARELNEQDRAFVVLSTQIGLTEVIAGQVALDRSEDPAVEAYARRMIVDHLQQLGHQLPILEKYDVELPELTQEQMTLVSDLFNLPPEQFDAAYITSQVVAHEQALALFTAAAEDSENRKVRKFADHHVPVLAEHLELAQEIAETQAVPAA